uniref:Turkey herpesvirus genes for Us1, Us10, Us2, protein kinase, glycoprotein D, glycoprotein I and glycoprotein E homologues, and ORF1 and ORF3 n=1 Tax=Gallid alphaherpesvirus 2 TaxID=10390 RepID=Q88526_9ALPH|nr:unnamed protein product [Gallid alphaherpesvirus 2]
MQGMHAFHNGCSRFLTLGLLFPTLSYFHRTQHTKAIVIEDTKPSQRLLDVLDPWSAIFPTPSYFYQTQHSPAIVIVEYTKLSGNSNS